MQPSSQKPSLGWIEPISRLLDSSFKIPGTRIRFGLDPLIGTVPVVGDLVMFLFSSLLFLNMAKNGASRKVTILMGLNIVTDYIIGSIPFIGWLFDFGFKANERNVKLLKEHYVEGRHQGSGTGIVLLVFLIVLLLMALIAYGSYRLVRWLWGFFDHSSRQGEQLLSLLG